ncbi:hypothetical protein GCM10025875_08030 [Litorihabitans aurantiacus]|uniref:Uncharacterized protein n=1 Tax=Litorihabitans aurantiacus TaxID=1930061 RepID=A0AA37XCZ0_9MICO|nr:hypothetical protein GCM10025875_08030 [Litorihabitans aurantiacus]
MRVRQRCERVPHREDGRVRGRAPLGDVQDHLELRDAVARTRRRDRCDAVDPLDRGRDLGGVRARGDERRVRGAGGEGLRDALRRGDRLRLRQELLGRVEAETQLGAADGEQGEHDDDAGAHRDRAARHAVADAPPHRPRLARERVAHAWCARPEHPSPEQHQAGGQADEHEEGGHRDADGAREPQAARGRHEGQQERQEPDDDGAGRAEHGFRGAAHRVPHRREPVRRPAQLVAVARDEQQRVVGAGAEHEDRQDARGRLVPRDVERRQHAGRDGGGGLVGDAHHGQRDHPQDRAAVGDHEEDGDDEGGDREQPHVRAVEHRGEVGLDTRRTRHLGGDAVGRPGVELAAQLDDGVGHRARAGRLDRDDAEGGGAVLRRDEHRLGTRDVGQQRADAAEPVGGERVGGEDHDGGRPRLVGEALGELGAESRVVARRELVGREPVALAAADHGDHQHAEDEGDEGEQPDPRAVPDRS